MTQQAAFNQQLMNAVEQQNTQSGCGKEREKCAFLKLSFLKLSIKILRNKL